MTDNPNEQQQIKESDETVRIDGSTKSSAIEADSDTGRAVASSASGELHEVEGHSPAVDSPSTGR